MPRPLRAAGAVLLFSGCVSQPGPRAAWRGASPTPFRFADPPSEVPAGRALGDSRQRVQSLTPPLSQRVTLELVSAFFRAITAENLEALATILAPDAIVPGKVRGSTTTVLDHWRSRMNHLRYQGLANQALYDEAQVETYHYQDWDGAVLANRPERPLEMTFADVLVRIPMHLVQGGNERLFGDQILLLLRPQHERLVVAEQLEDFALP